MIFTKSTISVALSLLSLTNAMPTAKSSTLTTRDDTQCKAGTSFYNCYKNNFRGCCSVDPCNLAAGCPVQTSVPTSAPTSAPTSVPTPDPTPQTPVCKGGKAQVYQPKMQSIQDGGEPVSASNLDLYKSTTEERYQTMTFTLPAGAKSCEVKWGIPAERNFTVGNRGVVDVWQGTDTDKKSIGAADFANWPAFQGPRLNNVGSAECQEKIELTTKLAATSKELEKEKGQETHVFLEQNEETGWFIEYQC